MSWLKLSQLSPLHAIGLFLFATGCGGGGHDLGPASGHPYPPPGDFGEVSTTGALPNHPGGQNPGPSGDCVEQRNTWADWEQSFAPGIASPTAAFAGVDHEVKTPLFWAAGPVDDGRLSWNVAGQSTHLTVRLSIDPSDTGRAPVFVASRPRPAPSLGSDYTKQDFSPNPKGHTSECPSYWELPVSIHLSTQDLALRESRIPGLLQIGSGGVSRLLANLPAQGLAGNFTWIVSGQNPSPNQSSGEDNTAGTSSTRSTWRQNPLPAVSGIELHAWMAKGIMWAQLKGRLPSDQSFELADGHADDPRCEDGRRLKVSADHPLGRLSAQQAIKTLQMYKDFELTWNGQEPKALRFAAVSLPREVCIDVESQAGPTAAMDMKLRVTFVDDKQARALTLTPHLRASLGMSAQDKVLLDLRYHAFSRGGESLPDFLTRHGFALPSVNAPQSGIFELSMHLRNQDHKTLSGSMNLIHYAQPQDCPDTSGDHQKDPKCDSLHGTSLRRGTLVGSQQPDSQ